MTDRLADVAFPGTDDPYRVRGSSQGNVSLLPAALEELCALSSPDEERLERLTRVCIDDVISAFGLGRVRRGRAVLELLSRRPAGRLARQVLTYDRIVGESGLGTGGAWALGKLSREARIEGQDNVPREGPLLLVSNHPGLADAVALFAAAPRDDLRVIAADRPFLDALPNTSRYLLTVTDASAGRTGVVRAAARHLRGGGAALTFPGGRIEPDPAVLPGATEALDLWSSSADLFARLTPGLAVVPVVVSGVISPSALRIPLTRLRRHKRDREWLAATLQMLIPALRNVDARVQFGRPIFSEPGATVGEAVIDETRRLMDAVCAATW
ncbi:MAG: 1-acyl-sn-glycerol-3-phosphate acyltransferase [Rubrobacteraceae bacterium]|nr:1-acyl-sn-glycerol-3-phosphate acyltransferase [Rubrobacteraceae bacterium]